MGLATRGRLRIGPLLVLPLKTTLVFQIFGFLTLRWIPVIFATSAAMFGVPATFEKILFGGAGKNGSTVAVGQAFRNLIQKYQLKFQRILGCCIAQR